MEVSGVVLDDGNGAVGRSLKEVGGDESALQNFHDLLENTLIVVKYYDSTDVCNISCVHIIY